MTKRPDGFVLRHDFDEKSDIMEQVTLPEFYHHIGSFLKFQLTMGQVFIENTHYERDDQIMCMIDGSAHIKLVPHVNRQEMHTGSGKIQEGHKNIHYREANRNESPINLFNPDTEKYPKFKFVNEVYSDHLSAGDCIFVPAFYYYSIAADAEPQEQKGKFKPAAIMGTLRYESGTGDLL